MIFNQLNNIKKLAQSSEDDRMVVWQQKYDSSVATRNASELSKIVNVMNDGSGKGSTNSQTNGNADKKSRFSMKIPKVPAFFSSRWWLGVSGLIFLNMAMQAYDAKNQKVVEEFKVTSLKPDQMDEKGNFVAVAQEVTYNKFNQKRDTTYYMLTDPDRLHNSIIKNPDKTTRLSSEDIENSLTVTQFQPFGVAEDSFNAHRNGGGKSLKTKIHLSNLDDDAADKSFTHTVSNFINDVKATVFPTGAIVLSTQPFERGTSMEMYSYKPVDADKDNLEFNKTPDGVIYSLEEKLGEFTTNATSIGKTEISQGDYYMTVAGKSLPTLN